MDDIISETDVDGGALRDVFRSPFLETKVDDDGDIHVEEGLGYPVWIALDREKKLIIKFFTFGRFEDADKNAELLSMVNDLNHSLVVVRFSLNPKMDEPIVDSDYFLSFAGGIGQAQVVRAAKRFASTSQFGFRKLEDTLRESKTAEIH